MNLTQDLSEDVKIIFFTKNLTQEIKAELGYRKAKTLLEAIDLAIDYDENFIQKPKKRDDIQDVNYMKN